MENLQLVFLEERQANSSTICIDGQSGFWQMDGKNMIAYFSRMGNMGQQLMQTFFLLQ